MYIPNKYNLFGSRLDYVFQKHYHKHEFNFFKSNKNSMAYVCYDVYVIYTSILARYYNHLQNKKFYIPKYSVK